MSEKAITNVNIVTPVEVVEAGTLVIADGRIRAVEPERREAGSDVLDGGGRWLLPGFVDVHNDGMEQELEPRPRAVFPLAVAFRSMENRLVSHGITTIFHSFSFMDGREEILAPDKLETAIRDIRHLTTFGAIRHLVHARYEIGEAQHYWRIQHLIKDGLVQLVSFMNHAPGQGQFRRIENFIDYYKRKTGYSRQDLQRLMEERIQKSRSDVVMENVKRLAEDARSMGIPMASHDDDSADKVAEMRELGVTIAEFPVVFDAAVAAASRGMHVVMGAPNVLRGKSNSGNLRAIDAIGAHAAHALCSDYYTPSLLHAVFALFRGRTLALPRAAALASLGPARAAGMEAEIGSIEVGKRADLILVGEPGAVPSVNGAWVNGARVYEKADGAGAAAWADEIGAGRREAAYAP